MQYVGQMGRSLKSRFGEQFPKMKKPNKFDTFLYHHSASKVLIQPVEKVYMIQILHRNQRNIKRREAEFKMDKHFAITFSFRVFHNIYNEGNISKMPDFDVFFSFGM